jgi:hypothetical protein
MPPPLMTGQPLPLRPFPLLTGWPWGGQEAAPSRLGLEAPPRPSTSGDPFMWGWIPPLRLPLSDGMGWRRYPQLFYFNVLFCFFIVFFKGIMKILDDLYWKMNENLRFAYLKGCCWGDIKLDLS